MKCTSTDQDPPCAHSCCAEDAADLDLVQGTSFRFFTAIEGNNDSIGKTSCDAQETQSYLILANSNILETSQEEGLVDVPLQKYRGELVEPKTPTQSSSVHEKDDFVSTSLFVRGNLDSHDSHEFFQEQRNKATDLIGRGDATEEEHDPSQGVSWKQESTDVGKKMKTSELDLPVSMMPTTPKVKASTQRDTPWKEEVVVEDAETQRCEDLRKRFLKIERNDFLSQKIAKELEDFTKNPSLGCYVSKPTITNGAGVTWMNQVFSI